MIAMTMTSERPTTESAGTSALCAGISSASSSTSDAAGRIEDQNRIRAIVCSFEDVKPAVGKHKTPRILILIHEA